MPAPLEKHTIHFSLEMLLTEYHTYIENWKYLETAK